MEKSTGRKCGLCSGGEVVERFEKELVQVEDSGTESRYKEVSKGFYCKKCGLMYFFPPPWPINSKK